MKKIASAKNRESLRDDVRFIIVPSFQNLVFDNGEKCLNFEILFTSLFYIGIGVINIQLLLT